MNEIQIDINPRSKKPDSSKSIKSVNSVKSTKSNDSNIRNKKSKKGSTKSLNSSKSVDNISQKSNQQDEKKIKEKKVKSNNSINVYQEISKDGKTEIYFDYSSLDNLKQRNNLLEPIKYTSQHKLNEIEQGDDENYKVINIDNNLEINKNNKSDTIININDLNNTAKDLNTSGISSQNTTEVLTNETQNEETKDKIMNIKNEIDDKDDYNEDNCFVSNESINESKEPLINKNEKQNDNNQYEKSSNENKLSEEEEKKQKLIEHYLKMPVRKTGLQCPWSLKQIVGLIIIAYSVAVNYYLIFNGEYNTYAKYVVLTISFKRKHNYYIYNNIVIIKKIIINVLSLIFISFYIFNKIHIIISNFFTFNLWIIINSF